MSVESFVVAKDEEMKNNMISAIGIFTCDRLINIRSK